MGSWILAHDLGTSGDKATLYGADGSLGASFTAEYPTHYGAGGVVEQDANLWWDAFIRATKQLLKTSGVEAKDIEAISFSGQMMGCVLVDGELNPLRPAIIWADTRARAQEAEFIRRVGMERGYRIIGHRISASYGACKLLWVRDNEPAVYANVRCMLNAKDFIVAKLCNVLCTDYSDAASTNLFDLVKKDWSDEILETLEISRDILPQTIASTATAGYVTAEAASLTGLMQGTRVIMGGGDGSCACVGAGVVREGSTYNVLGSSSWTSCASKEPVFDEKMRTFNWVHLDENFYTPCGTMQAAGNSFNWMRDNIATGKGFDERSVYDCIDEAVKNSPIGAKGLIYLPYLLGERSPRWNMEASGAFIGLGMNTGKGDLCRAVLEGVGFNLKIIGDILEEQVGDLGRITLIGGGAQSRVWMQILSDIWEKEIAIPKYLHEATSIGAAVCGGVGAGMFESFDVIEKFNPVCEIVKPNGENFSLYRDLYRIFDQSYEALLGVYHELNRFQ